MIKMQRISLAHSPVFSRDDRVNCHRDFPSLAAEVTTHRNKWRIRFIFDYTYMSSLDCKSKDFEQYHPSFSKCSTNHLDISARGRFINDLKCALMTKRRLAHHPCMYKVARSPSSWKCSTSEREGLTTPFSSLSKKVTGTNRSERSIYPAYRELIDAIVYTGFRNYTIPFTREFTQQYTPIITDVEVVITKSLFANARKFIMRAFAIESRRMGEIKLADMKFLRADPPTMLQLQSWNITDQFSLEQKQILIKNSLGTRV